MTRGRRKTKGPKPAVKQDGKLLSGGKPPEQQGFLQPDEQLGRTQEQVEVMPCAKIEGIVV